MPWFDVWEADCSGALPARLRELYQRSKANDSTGLDLVTDIGEARALLAFSNRNEKRNEIIGLYSSRLAQMKTAIRVPSGTIQWVGFDVAPPGDFSLLLEGIFARPELFVTHRSALNAAGVLVSKTEAESYVVTYRALSDQGLVEELVYEPHEVDAIRVGRLRATGGKSGSP